MDAAERPAQTGEYDEGMQALLQHVWGDGFLSPGGAQEIARLLEGVDLRGRRVLDIGCGLGAIDVLLVTHHGAAQVTGIDLDAELIAKARARIPLQASASVSTRVSSCPDPSIAPTGASTSCSPRTRSCRSRTRPACSPSAIGY